MADYIAQPVTAMPRQSMVTLTHVLYGMHAFSALMGVLGTTFIITSFLTGWPSIIAVIVNYIKRDEVRGTFLDSHFSWQLRTFWYALLWVFVIGLLCITLIGIPIAWRRRDRGRDLGALSHHPRLDESRFASTMPMKSWARRARKAPRPPLRMSDDPRSVRIDKWLWAARFFKTRSGAQQAIEGGKVKLNGDRTKPAKELKPGDELVDSHRRL